MISTLNMPQKPTTKILNVFGILLLLTVMSLHPMYGQTATHSTSEITSSERVIKGIVSDEVTGLEGVNIIQQGSTNGTVTNEKGEFTFPNTLKAGDILLFSYLGYKTQKVEIKDDTTFITLVLSEDLIEISGALQSVKPYTSKRKN